MILINGVTVEPTIFPDGTSQVWKLPPTLIEYRRRLDLTWYFEAEREIFDLYAICELFPTNLMTLHMPYLPYARQDKEVSNSKTFSLRVFAKLLNELKFAEVTAVDVHNPEETAKLIRGFVNIPIHSVHKRVLAQLKPDYIVYPDLGAYTRYNSALKKDCLILYKERNQSTGEITGHSFTYRDPDGGYHTTKLDAILEEGEHLLMIDDICDGGATFISAAKTLKTAIKNPKISLFVTHGLFSKGREVLEEAGIEVYTTDTLLKNTDGYPAYGAG